MTQVGRVEPVDVAELGGRGRRRRVVGHIVTMASRSTKTRTVANSSSGQRRSRTPQMTWPKAAVDFVNCNRRGRGARS
jgi:hypothetical protein